MNGAPGVRESDTIPVLAAVPNEASAKLVEVLEEFLEMARAGDLTSLAYVFIGRGGEGGCGARGAQNAGVILGQLEPLKRELLRYVERDDVEVLFDE